MMERLRERGEQIGRQAQQRKIDEMARFIAERLPRAEIERLTSGLSIRGPLLLDRWLDDTELRFLGSMGR